MNKSASVVVSVLAVSAQVHAADVPADPQSYVALLATLSPGDRMVLAPGDYADGMNLFDLHGSAGAEITIAGPKSGAPARFLGKGGKNTVDIRNSSYLVLQDLVLDGQGIAGIDAIKAGGQAGDSAHHITIAGCTITGHDGSQQTVGISTKIVTWDWVIRDNVIDGAGTGAYLGNSDGTRAFIGGVIERNLFRDTVGYNMQIKHQLHRQQADVPDVPTDARATVIRHNVFIKDDDPSPDGARPNLLVDGPPDSGPGSEDHVEIYGNFFFHNPGDALFQGNGRLHIHDNVFVDSAHPALRLTSHAGKTLIDAFVYNNTIYATEGGIALSSAATGATFVVGNAVFTDGSPITGAPGAADNVTGSVAEASSYVVMPSTTLGQMDFYPCTGSALAGSALDLSNVASDSDYDRDFNGTTKDFTYRGAYHGEGKNPGWQLDATPKTVASGGTGGGPGGTGGAPSGGAAGGSSGGASAGAAGSGLGSSSSGAASDDDGGCGCRASPSSSPISWWALGVLAAFRWRRRR